MNTKIVTAARCPLMHQPSLDSEQVDELLTGWTCQVLQQSVPDWLSVRSEYGYEGFAQTALLRTLPAVRPIAPPLLVRSRFCPVLTRPQVRSRTVAELLQGARVIPLGTVTQDGWQRVALPSGAQGFAPMCKLMATPSSQPSEENTFRQAVVNCALSYLGAPYLWGGKSPLGIDCSGLAFMAYWLCGVTIYRDARMEPGFPIHAIAPSQMRMADLLFFPGHVAIYFGKGRYVHATAHRDSFGVTVNSLDPASSEYRADLAGSITAVGSLF